MEGSRFNEGKPRWSLVDFKSLEGMVRVLEFGADKYGDFNWQKGLKTTEICESLMRHLFAYLRGEDLDSESGLRHIDHIMCNSMFLSYMDSNRPDFDTRQDRDNGYKDITEVPKRFDTYLVKTKEGCYDFAHFTCGEWNKGTDTGGTPKLWREIPQAVK